MKLDLLGLPGHFEDHKNESSGLVFTLSHENKSVCEQQKKNAPNAQHQNQIILVLLGDLRKSLINCCILNEVITF